MSESFHEAYRIAEGFIGIDETSNLLLSRPTWPAKRSGLFFFTPETRAYGAEKATKPALRIARRRRH